jgi:hypothetical protein
MLVIIVLIVVVLGSAVFLFVRKLRQKKIRGRDERTRHKTAPGQRPVPKNISCLVGKTSLTESLQTLAEKYSFDEFTIVTADGLLLGSSRNRIPAADAATYSELFFRKQSGEMPGVVLFGLAHKDSTLIGVIRSKNPMTRETELKVTNETKDILNWWI